MSRFFDLLVATEVYADIDFIMSPQEDGKTETFYLEGTLTSLTVDWGDGTTTTASTTNSHTYTSAGDYRVRVLGDCRAVTRFAVMNPPLGDNKDITLVNRMLIPNATSGYWMFSQCNRLTRLPDTFDLPNATNIVAVFYDCKSLVSLPKSFHAKKARNLYYAFFGTTSLASFGGFKLQSNVLSLSWAFSLCGYTGGINDILPSTWDNAVDLTAAFRITKFTGTVPANLFWNWSDSNKKLTYDGITFVQSFSLTNYYDIPSDARNFSSTTGTWPSE